LEGEVGSIVVIFDEANRLPTEFPVDLLISSEQALAQSGVTTVYVASPEIVESFQPLRESFSRELFLGPFPGVDDMRRLLARYYFDDATRVNSLPVADEASQRLWHLSNGVPYIIQLLAECSFRIGREKGARTLKAVHVTAAYEELKAERKLTYFGTAGDET